MTRPRLLIVEDREQIREDLVELFGDPSPELVESYGVDGFCVESAPDGETAVAMLQAAIAEVKPYDVLLLDIGLPLNGDKDTEPDTDVGVGILRAVNPQRFCATEVAAPAPAVLDLSASCTAVVIQSVHAEVCLFVEYLREGAADFIAKPFEEEEIYARVAQAYKKAREIQRRQWAEQQRERIEKWRLVQTCARIADEFARTASDGVAMVLQRARELAEIIEDQLQIDPTLDRDDPLVRKLAELRQAARETAEKCAQGRDTTVEEEGISETVKIREVLGEVIDRVRPGFAWHGVALDRANVEDLTVHTLRREIGAILTEVVSHAIEDCGDQGSIAIATKRDGNVAICVGGRRRDGVKRTNLASRNEGLLLAQRAARNLGARIEIDEADSDSKITLYIPVGSHDQE